MKAAELPQRMCGRCRASFAADPTLPPGARDTFWLCARCRAILLPGRPEEVETAKR
jgi:hypothetical protein